MVGEASIGIDGFKSARIAGSGLSASLHVTLQNHTLPDGFRHALIIRYNDILTSGEAALTGLRVEVQLNRLSLELRNFTINQPTWRPACPAETCPHLTTEVP